TFHLVAVADTRGLVHQYAPLSTNFAVRDVLVRPNQVPDVAVEDFHVRDASGNEATKAFAGDLLRITGTIANRGTAHAADVDAASVVLHVANHRATDATATLVAQAGDGLVVTGLPPRLDVPHGSESAVAFTVTASPFAKPGLGTVQVALVPDGGAALATAQL